MNARGLWLVLLAMESPWTAHAATRLLALAADDRMTVMVGKYDDRRGWMASTDFYDPPQPGDPFTLYGSKGYVSHAVVTDAERANPHAVFADWTANLSAWNNRETPEVLAVSGERPLSTDPLPPTPLGNPEFQAVVKKYLQEKGLVMEAPSIVEALEIPVFGRREIVLVAQSDPKALETAKPAPIYSVCLLWWRGGPDERVEVLSSQTSLKPAGRTLEEHQRFNGSQEFLHIVAAEDVDADGWREIVLRRRKDDAVQVDVFSFNGRRLKTILTASKADYN